MMWPDNGYSVCRADHSVSAQVTGCLACGTAPKITAATLPSYDYGAFTGAQPNDAAPPQLDLLADTERLSPAALRELLTSQTEALVVDVRPRNQFDIAHIPGGRPFAFPSCLPLRLRSVQLVLVGCSHCPSSPAPAKVVCSLVTE